MRKKTITVENHELHFEFPFKEFLVFESVVVVLFELPSDHEGSSQNVKGFDFVGNEIWRIAKDPYRPDFNYVSITAECENVRVINFSTNQFLIEAKTGKVLNQKQVK